MESLFNDDSNHSYTTDACDIDLKLRNFARSIFQDYRGRYSPRELSHVMMLGIMEEEMTENLGWNDNATTKPVPKPADSDR